MYLSFYDLKTEPFKISTDPEFLWLGEKHKEALATLRYGILGNKGILLLTGDVGTGKTTLINMLLNNLGDDTIVATVPDPGLDRMDFYNFVANAFNINKTFTSKGEFILYLSQFLKKAYNESKKVLLIIDEAQRLNKDLLEEIRLLSNIELQHTKLINLFFVGQIEFNDIISSEENKALRQRITLRYNIEPLNLKETQEYIKYRLQVAGSTKEIFTPNAISELYSFSKGYPRLINVICDYALLTGFVKEKIRIDESIIKECALELKIPTKVSKNPVKTEPLTESIAKPPEIIWQPYEVRSPEKEQPIIQAPASSKQRTPLFYKVGIVILVLLLLLILANQFYSTSNFKTNIISSITEKFQLNASKKNQDETKQVAVKLPDNSVSMMLDKEIPVNKPVNNSAFPEEKNVYISKAGPEHKNIKNTPENPESSRSQPETKSLTNNEPLNKTDSTDLNKFDKVLSEQSADITISPEPVIAARPKDDMIPVQKDIDQIQTIQPMGIYDGESDNSYISSIFQQSSENSSESGGGDKTLIFFESNSFSLTDEAIRKLDRIIKMVEQYPDMEITIKGYTDNTGPFVYNERLSVFRAFSVKSYLVDKGINPSMAKAYGMGPRPPYDEEGNRIPIKITRAVEIEIKTVMSPASSLTSP